MLRIGKAPRQGCGLQADQLFWFINSSFLCFRCVSAREISHCFVGRPSRGKVFETVLFACRLKVSIS